MALLLSMDDTPRRNKPGPKPVTAMILEQWHDDYINLLADPQDKRTNIEFYKSVPIDERTFYRWLKRFRDDVYEEANRRLRSRRSELRIKGWKRLESMFDDKHSGAVIKSLELFFKLNGDLIERTENRTELLTPEQKKVRLAKFLSEIASKRGKSSEEEVSEDELPEGSEGESDSPVGGEGDEPGEDSADSGEQTG